MVLAQIKDQERAHCVCCNKKRLSKFLYILKLPFNRKVIKVCVDCYDKYINHATIIRSAEVDTDEESK